MYKKIMRYMCENAIYRYFLLANDGLPLVPGSIGIEQIELAPSKYMKDTIIFDAEITMRTADVVRIHGYADEYGAVCTHYEINGNLVSMC